MKAGGQKKSVKLVRYMDERERTQLYRMEHGYCLETDRDRAEEAVRESDAKYAQHLVVTTSVQSREVLYDPRDLAEQVGRQLQDRFPDASIYAMAVHGESDKGDRHLHVHVALGTQRPLQKDDLLWLREQAHELQRTVERSNGLERHESHWEYQRVHDREYTNEQEWERS